MATTALSVGRQELSVRANLTTPEAATFSTTTNITTNNSVISTELPGAGYTTDDYFGPDGSWWIIITGTANASVVRRVTDYAQSTGTLTVGGAALAAETGSVTFELHKVHPTLLRRALNDASRDVYPAIFRRVIDETLWTSSAVRRYLLPSPWATGGVVDVSRRLRQIWLFRSPTAQSYGDNILKNGGFASWTSSSVAADWTATDLTLAREQATTSPRNYAVLTDSDSAKCTALASTAGRLLQSISTPSTHDGLNFAFSVWVYCTTASRVFARITVNSTDTDSANHGGTGWERLTVVAEGSVALTTLEFSVRVSSAAAAIIFYVDEGLATAGAYRPPSGEEAVLRGWRLEEQVAASPSLPAGMYLVLDERPPDRYQMRLVGTDYLTQFTATETSTVEIGTPQVEILYAYALRRLARAFQSEDAATWDRVGQQADQAVADAVARHKMALPPYLGLPYDLGR